MKVNFYPLIVFIALIISCTDTHDDIDNSISENIESNQIILTPEEYTSIAYDNPKELSEKEIIEIVNSFHNINSVFKNEAVTKNTGTSKVSIINKYYLANQNGDMAMPYHTRSQKTSKVNVPIFEIELSTDGEKRDYALVCGDERVPKVLFYANDYDSSVEMNIPMRYLIEVAKKSVFSDIELIEKIKFNKRDSTLNRISKDLNIPKEHITDDFIERQIIVIDDIGTKSFNNPIGGVTNPPRIISMVSPMSVINWHQNYPYNLQLPKGLIWDGYSPYIGNIDVGCANIAVATLFSIIKPPMVGVTSTGRQILIDWDYVTSKRNLYIDEDDPSISSPPKMVEMVGSLLKAIFDGTKSYTNSAIKETFDEDGNKVEKEVIIETSTKTGDMLSYISTMASYPASEKFNAYQVKQSLQDHKPVLLFGNGHFRDDNNKPIQEEPYKDNEPGHGWVIDGYCMTRGTGQAINDHYWSVNMGWGRNASSIYFKTQDNFQDCDVVFKFNSTPGLNIVYSTQEQSMIYNVEKK